MKEFFLAFCLWSANELTLAKQYEASDFVLRLSRSKSVKADYLLGVNAFALQNKALAIKHLTYVRDGFSDVPERYRVMAEEMLYDLRSWKDGDLGDIGRDMGAVKDRLENKKADQKTTAKQLGIVEKLDKLIKEKEDAAKAAQQAGNVIPLLPQEDSAAGTVSGKGLVDNKKLKQLAEVWGKLPPKDRAKALVEITKDLPPKHRELIESYFRTLARTGVN